MEFNTMALVSCPECQKEVSTHALACPQCALPFPGKQARGVGQAGTKLYSCPDCGCLVSKQAQTCPHCGVTLEGEQGEGEQRPLTIKPNFVEETWLCTHCGTPYTRKVRQENVLVTDHQVVVPPSKVGGSVGRLLEPAPHQETVVPPSKAGGSVGRLLEPASHQETVVPPSNGGRSVEKLLEPVPHQETVVPPSKAGGSVGRLLEPASHQETVVPPSNGGRSVEKLLEPVPHQEAVVPPSNTGQSVERFLERVPHQEVAPTSNEGQSVERPLGPIPHQVKRGNVSASSRRRSQLWQDSSFGEEIESFLPRRYPRSRKKSILLGLLVFILIAAAVVSGALWQLQGINPLEVLVYWRM